jgi:hypothetical protein
LTAGARLRETVEGSDVVYYLVYSLSRRDFRQADQTATELAQAAADAGVPRVYLVGLRPLHDLIFGLMATASCTPLDAPRRCHGCSPLSDGVGPDRPLRSSEPLRCGRDCAVAHSSVRLCRGHIPLSVPS